MHVTDTHRAKRELPPEGRPYWCRLVSSPALATIAATGGTSPTATEITMAAVTEYSRTTVQARITATRQPPMSAKYARLRVMVTSPGHRPLGCGSCGCGRGGGRAGRLSR